MELDLLFLRDDSRFSSTIREWAEAVGIMAENYYYRPSDDQEPDGLLLINENQDIRKDLDEIHSFFDRKHIPTQKIDINGTLQVAINNFKMWKASNKCRKILVLGSDELVDNDNLNRFLGSI